MSLNSRQADIKEGLSARRRFVVPARDFLLSLGVRTQIMGIVNVTPDSFSGDGRLRLNQAILYAQKLIRDGADIIDVGGESTRPGAKRISVEEELKRVIPVIKNLAPKVNIPISVDTYKPLVAQQALEAGASLVNNIMGSKLNKSLLKMVKNYDAAIVLMHISGTPQTMQRKIKYNNLVKNIIDSLGRSIENCLEIGIKLDKIIIDPGIGFGKTVGHNLTILNQLDHFKVLKRPLLIGTSRKAFIGKILNKQVDHRLIGTVASVCAAIMKGVQIVRVHDVRAVKEVVMVTDAIINESY